MDKVCIIGLSEPILTIVLDNFESNSHFPEIIVINNFKRKNSIPFGNKNIQINSKENINNKI